jgi:acyl-CoA reductase-like NAD-dependent aldehyde dehydrogenase
MPSSPPTAHVRSTVFLPVFAPVITVIPYDTVEAAISIANGTRYGLGASVFGPTQRECVAVARSLECGMVSVNDFGVFYVSQSPSVIYSPLI